MTDKEHLQWIYKRLWYVHNDSVDIDFMKRFKKIIDEYVYISNIRPGGMVRVPSNFNTKETLLPNGMSWQQILQQDLILKLIDREGKPDLSTAEVIAKANAFVKSVNDSHKTKEKNK